MTREQIMKQFQTAFEMAALKSDYQAMAFITVQMSQVLQPPFGYSSSATFTTSEAPGAESPAASGQEHAP